MANIDKHPAGSFCWIELHTTDQNAAKSFYNTLFGWAPEDMPMGPNDFYTIWKLQGRDAAAGCTLRPEERSQGVPPHWMIYIAVDNADAAAAKAQQLGGKILAPAFDVMDAGRMAVVLDPTGAVFCVWQANRNTGIGIAQVAGTLCWADLSTPDAKRASDFYSGLFGWQIAADPKDTSGYLHIKNGDHFIGGVPPAAHRQPGVPPHWMAYFQVDDVDGVASNAKKMGANLYLPPTTMEGVGRMSVIADPQGAVFAIFKSARG
ncbi:MAG TPA: VOC family protein [Terriglobales bacterium]|jgi:predicted enzyme related to lactoylglutathione lyase|nr:VOC family protein [Terriglobales bacterium]